MNPRSFGRATEARFVFDAVSRGMLVSRTVDQTPGYDMVVDAGGRLFRVSVKGVNCGQRRRAKRGRYGVTANRTLARASRRFDIMAIWLSGEGRWMFLPRRAVPRYTTFYISPGGRYDRRGWEIFLKRK